MVSSARVQQVIKGDDVVFTHQIVEKSALDAKVSLAPVMLQTGDTVRAVYEGQDGSDVGQAATFTGAPTSRISVPLTQEQTKLLKSGEAQTVRIEITRLSGAKETHYLFEEFDVLERGFPQAEPTVTLP